MSAATTEDEPSPNDLDARSWKFVARSVIRKFGQDGAGDIAAGLTFHAVLALIPAIMVVVSVVSLLGKESETVTLVLEVSRAVASPEVAKGLASVVDMLAESSIAGLALLTGLALTIWAGARYIAVLGRGMNRVYDVEEGRRGWALKLMQLAVSVLLFVAVLAVAALLALSEPVARAIGDALSLGDSVLIAWQILRWPLLAAIVIAAVAFLYDRAPNVRHVKFRWVSLGAGIAILVLIIASALFSLYVSSIVDYDRVYGPLAGAIIFLLWMWIANLALMLGVEFDAAVERARELRAGEPAEFRVRLPLRDDTQIEAKNRRSSEEVAEARELRNRSEGVDG
ncbi:YihY/virulence factor BrkB family protein [Microbacterium sp. SSW1-49]|uniref:YihY/virulence factor BrkB family protein n=1 Tax=Microbacterium croceum TaxID=2851645 RepID=A0ABT0FF70_9MICO|nr:YihY/virulence factor BrkB family protein [Microbacterium croceum]MCK2036710.1 YihY/virulence factor BrkB family protein [Microbacterium croceum]